MNTICLIGRLGQNPQLKQTPNGVVVCGFSLAVKRPGTKDITDWISCAAFRQNAEYLCQYGKKGTLAAVTGVLNTRSYTDREGKKRTAYEVIADRVQCLPGGSGAALSQESADGSRDKEEGLEFGADEDLPF